MSKRIARIVFAILGIAIGLSIADFIVTRSFLTQFRRKLSLGCRFVSIQCLQLHSDALVSS